MTDRQGAAGPRAYLDHAASTPMLPACREAMAGAATLHGNPASLHAAGRAARRALEESRERIAAALGAHPLEVVLTSGGTEGANLAVAGLYRARRHADPARRRILVGAVEHHAVLDAAHWLAAYEGAELALLPVDALGRVRLDAVADALAADGGPGAVSLVSVMWANNEVGTLQPVAEVAVMCERAGVPLHTDAVQAVGQVPVDFSDPELAGVRALSVSGHKFGGPSGSGALLLRRDEACVPLLHGGGQERGVRSGSNDVVGAAGLAAAVAEVASDLLPGRSGRLARSGRSDTLARLAALRDTLVAGVFEAVPEAVLNGDPSSAGRLPGNAHFSFPGCRGDSLLMLLDAAGVDCSAGSACNAGVARLSHVLTAMGVDRALARSSLRFSLGHTSTADDVALLLSVLPDAVARSRAAVGVLR